MRTQLFIRAAAPLLWLSCLMYSTTAATAEADSEQQFGDWSKRCVAGDAPNSSACHIYQRVVVEGEDDNEKAVQLSLGYSPDESNPVAVIRMPLGLWLLNGITLAVDDIPGQRFPVQVCASAGCQTTLRLEPEMVDTLKNGQQLFITTYNVRREAVRVPLSLDGFAKALDTLQAN